MGTAALIQVKPKPFPVASFSFRGVAVSVELTEDGAVAVHCPVCGTRCCINPATHEVIVNLRTRIAMTIYPGIICPSGQCGFEVVVLRGRAFEVEANKPPPEPEKPLLPGELRCVECQRGFNPGMMGGRGREVCQRCTPNNRGKWSTKKKA